MASLADGADAAVGILVIAEIALAVVLLAGAGVMMRSFLNVSAADVGAKTSNVVTLSLALPEVRYRARRVADRLLRTAHDAPR